MELLHNESLKELLHSENFWVAVAFFIFITCFDPSLGSWSKNVFDVAICLYEK